MHGKAKEQAEIDGEKEIIETSTIQAMGKDKYGDVRLTGLQTALNSNAGDGKTEVIDNGDTLVVKFVDSGRYYEVDSDGNVNVFEAYEDKTPGELAKNSKGEFMIESIEDLIVFSAMVNGGYSDNDITIESNQFSGSRVILMCNLNFNSNLSYNNYASTIYNGYLGVDDTTITLKDALTNSKYVGFIPIGNDNLKNHFKGDFDGQYHEIQKIYINKNSGMVGLFGMTSGSNISDLGISGTIASENGSFCAGIVARADGSVISNCYNKATINGTIVGGIASGLGETTIKDCYNVGNITGTGTYVGGIASGHGNHKTTVINCYNKGKIVGGNQTGGILGANGDIIENCYNTGEITSTGNYIGGIIGGYGAQKIKKCYNTGNIISDFGRIGGISCNVIGEIINCYNIGNISITDQLKGVYIGGIACINESDATISNCFNVGKFSSAGRFSGEAAGILAINKGNAKISNCYSLSIVELKTGKGQGIVGSNSGTVTLNKCYYLKSTNIPFAIASNEDDTSVVTSLKSINEITAEILNGNISKIEHEDEWNIWVNGKDGYPIFK